MSLVPPVNVHFIDMKNNSIKVEQFFHTKYTKATGKFRSMQDRHELVDQVEFDGMVFYGYKENREKAWEMNISNR